MNYLYGVYPLLTVINEFTVPMLFLLVFIFGKSFKIKVKSLTEHKI